VGGGPPGPGRGPLPPPPPGPAPPPPGRAAPAAPTTLYPQAGLAPHRTTAFVCGPEIMMRFAAAGLVERGVPAERVHVSMERNMQCAVRMCGHCQWGPVFVCADGPVFPWSRAREWLEVAQL